MEYKTSRQIEEEQRTSREISDYVTHRQRMDNYERSHQSIREAHDRKLTQEHLDNYNYPKLEDFPEYDMLLNAIDELKEVNQRGDMDRVKEVSGIINNYIAQINARNLWTKETLTYVQGKIQTAVASKTR